MSYRYYSTQRPISPMTFPMSKDNKVLGWENFDERKPCYDIQRDAWGYIDYEKPLTEQQAKNYELVKQLYPKYIKTTDGYIGTFQYLDFGEFPVYRFPGGDQIADGWEIEHGSNDRKELEARS